MLDENDSKPELIGDTVIRLEEAFKSRPDEGFDKWHELEYKGKFAGEIYIEMTFYPAKPLLPPKKRSKSPSKLKKTQQQHELPVTPMVRPLPYEPGQEPEIIIPMPDPPTHVSTEDSQYHPLRKSGGSTHSLPPLPPFNGAYSNENSSTVLTKDILSVLPEIPPLPQTANETQLPTSGTIPRVPVGSKSTSNLRRKPINSGLPHNNKFDEGIDELPFSAESFNTPPPNRQAATAQIHTMRHSKSSNDVLDRRSYAPEPIPKPKPLPKAPGYVDPGIGGYIGEGQWDISRQINDGYGDSIFNKVIRNNLQQPPSPPKPKLPPKVPMGMTREEYIVTNNIIDEEEEDRFMYRTYD